jgi:glycosyltransferase involved in cell wall biosynthesis
LKILFPLEYIYPSLIDGKGFSIYTLTKELSKSGLDISIVSSPKGIDLRKLDLDKFYLKYNLKVSFLKESFFSHMNITQIRNVIHNDVIQFSSFFYTLTIWYFFLAIIFKKKIIISPRGEFYSAALKRKWFIKIIYIKLFKIFQKRINFHATNRQEKKLIKNLFPKSNIVIIPNLINIPKCYNKKKKKNIIFLGRINPIKNIDILIKAYSCLSSNIKSEFSLLIVGEAHLDYEKKCLNKLKLIIKDNRLEKQVKFLGPVYKEDKLQILSESYCLVLPSKSENFGNVVLEAISQNTPVIASKNTPWEILKENNAGYWVDASIGSIKNALNEVILINDEKYTEIQNRAMSLLNDKFSYNNNIYMWSEYYSKL